MLSCASGHPINENLIFRLLLVFTVVLDGRKLYLSAVRCWAQLISYRFFSFFCWLLLKVVRLNITVNVRAVNTNNKLEGFLWSCTDGDDSPFDVTHFEDYHT